MLHLPSSSLIKLFMTFLQQKIAVSRNPCKGILFIALPQLLLVVVVAGLLVLMVSVCIKLTKGPLSTTALKRQLILLQARFVAAALVNPDLEREKMEALQNNIKTSSSPLTISGDYELRVLFHNNCESIQSKLYQPDLDNRTGWIKLNELMTGFNAMYFPT
jgi:hypothetical protein